MTDRSKRERGSSPFMRLLTCVVFSGLAACASSHGAANEPSPFPLSISANASPSHKRFDIEPGTIICTSVNVDEGLLGRPIDTDWRYGLSGSLVKELRRNFSAMGKLGGPDRFRPDPFNVDPKCATPSAIRVELQYSNQDGRKFRVLQRISLGTDKSEKSRFRDIEAEWASGELIKYAQSDPVIDAISDDLKKAAKVIVEDEFSIN